MTTDQSVSHTSTPHDSGRSPDASASLASGPRRGWARRVARIGLLTAGAAAALALAGPLALRPFTDVAGAAGEVAVGFVVDLGLAGGPVTGCVTVPASDNRYDALAAFLAQHQLPAATFASSGLLCSIAGIPTTGCGQTVPGGYVYWAYYTGNGRHWQYASSGAFDPVGQQDVEGWKFQDPGTGRPNDPPPAIPPNYGTLCAATPTPSTTTTRPSHSHPAANGHGKKTTTTTDSNSTSSKTTAGSTTTLTTTVGGQSTDTTDSTTTTFPGDPAVPSVGTTTHVEGPSRVSLAVGGLLILGLAGVAVVRWRRRSRTP